MDTTQTETRRYFTAGPAARARAAERLRAEQIERRALLVERLTAAYERDSVAHGIEYAEIVWGSSLRDLGAHPLDDER